MRGMGAIAFNLVALGSAIVFIAQPAWNTQEPASETSDR
jgi:hypothetical protein